MAELKSIETHGLEDAVEKAGEHRERIKTIEERLAELDRELLKLRKRMRDDPPPPEFDQSWSQKSRALVRLLASKERDRIDLVRAKTAATKNYEAYLVLMEKEAEQQLKADRTWWSKRRQEWQHQTQTAKDREDLLRINPVLTDLRARVTDEDSYSKVKAALEAVEDAEMVAAIERARPSFGIDFHRRQAITQLKAWHQSRP